MNAKASIDSEYCNLLHSIMTRGNTVTTRNSTVKRLEVLTLDCSSCPLISIRKTAWKNALREWEWFMSGSSNINDLHPKVQHWWKPWANKNGEVRNNYSQQFRRYNERKEYFYDYEKDDREGERILSFDQMEAFINGIKKHPNSRRNILTTWHAEEMWSKDTPITNCHNSLTQAFVNNGELTIATVQRSADMVCGLPHNLIQMWAFLLYVAYHTGTKPGVLKWVGFDCHIYEQHFDLVDRMLNVTVSDISPINMIYTPTSKEFLVDDFTLDTKYVSIMDDKAEMVV